MNRQAPRNPRVRGLVWVIREEVYTLASVCWLGDSCLTGASSKWP
jgi:hypothetical protein